VERVRIPQSRRRDTSINVTPSWPLHKQLLSERPHREQAVTGKVSNRLAGQWNYSQLQWVFRWWRKSAFRDIQVLGVAAASVTCFSTIMGLQAAKHVNWRCIVERRTREIWLPQTETRSLEMKSKFFSPPPVSSAPRCQNSPEEETAFLVQRLSYETHQNYPMWTNIFPNLHAWECKTSALNCNGKGSTRSIWNRGHRLHWPVTFADGELTLTFLNN
jgi:hypothetical protein